MKIRVAAQLWWPIISLGFIQTRNITRAHMHVSASCGGVLMIRGVGLRGVTQRQDALTAALDRCFVDPDGEIVHLPFKRNCGKTWPSERFEERGLQSGVKTFFAASGAGFFLLFTHALRRGLHSFALSRLEATAACDRGDQQNLIAFLKSVRRAA